MNQQLLLHPVLSEQETKELLDINNPKCAFHESKWVGNRDAVEEILDLANSAFETRLKDSEGNSACPRICNKKIALLGRPSCGKTTLARTFAREVLKLPYCETVPEQVQSPERLFELLQAAWWDTANLEVIEDEDAETVRYRLPPGVLFIDEIHLLPPKVQDSLLKVTEANDGLLVLHDAVVDCKLLCIIIATTDKGKLRSAFKTRFRQINLHSHTIAEVAKIVKISNPTWSDDDCRAVAVLKQFPREAKDFAESVLLAQKRSNLTIPQAIEVVAKREGIGPGGVNANAIRTLKLLKETPEGLSLNSLCVSLSIEAEEFQNDVKPCLVANELHSAYIEIVQRHTITPEGLKYLEELK